MTATISSLILFATTLSGGAVFALNSLNKNIKTVDTSDLLAGKPSASPRPPSDTSAINFLVMGSDTREGQGAGFGDAGGARSDTTLLVHLYEGRRKALVVSIPRDSEITIPYCKDANGNGVGPWTTKFNAAFAVGGPVCTIKTLQEETGISVDKFVVIDFKAFKAVVDALGGVRVCLTTPVYDPYVPGRGGSGLNLPAGYSNISGKQALAWVRARETLGDGSDLSRIQRQQEFLGSMVRGVKEKGILTSPSTIYKILSAVTSSLTTSSDLGTVQALEDFALSLVNLDPAQITFVTTPYFLKGDGNVHWNSKTDELWKTIKDGGQWPPKDEATASPSAEPNTTDAPTSSPSASPSTGATNNLVTPPSSIKVKVLDGSGTKGLAQQVASELKAMGFVVTAVGKTNTPVTSTQVNYNKKFKAGAATLSYAANTTNIVKSTTLVNTFELIIGPDWIGSREVVVQPNTNVEIAPTEGISAATNICTQGNNRVKTK